MFARKQEAKQKRILIVDDDYVVHRYAARICKGLNARLRHAYNAREARRIIGQRIRHSKELPFDLVICDVHMPPHDRPSGQLLVRELRKRFPRMGIIMHSDDLPVLAAARRGGLCTVYKLASGMQTLLRNAIKKELKPSRSKAT